MGNEMYKEVGTLADIGAKVGDKVEFVHRGKNDLGYFMPETGSTHVVDEVGKAYGMSPRNDDSIWRIISRANKSPVREVTRKEIVPGVYGKVSVFKDDPHINHFIEVSDYMSRDDLIAARDVFNQLIEAMSDQND